MPRQFLGKAAEAAFGVGLFALAILFLSPARVEPPPHREPTHQGAGGPLAAPALNPDSANPAMPELSYRLNARLNASSKRVDGDGEIRFRNSSRYPVRTLWFHLYLNAFKNSRTLFFRSPFTAGRGGGKPTHWGHIDVSELTDLRTGDALWPGPEAHSPGDPEDRTDIEVKLVKPLAPGETIRLGVRWVSQLPKIVERTGFSEDYFFVGQWFPKLASFVADDGSGNATFRHFAFHPQAEFHADFADYTVTLDVPAGMAVGATGERKSERSANGRRVLEYTGRGVHDFAWTAWPGFQVSHQSIAGIDVRLMFPPGHERNREKTLEALEFALPYFEKRYGEYPYPNLTVVHPPPHAADSGGMEYPTLITTGGSWHVSLYSRAIEMVTIHELAHQWFYGLVASDEARWPFLDEGFASYAEAAAVKALYGQSSAAAALGVQLSADAVRRASGAAIGMDAPLSLPAAKFPSFEHLGALVYNRTATLLATYEALYGDRFVDLMRAYALKFRFAHPDPEDFLDTVAQHLGDAARQTMEEALFERGVVDYVMTKVESSRAPSEAGVFAQGESRETSSRPSSPPALHVGRVVLVRRGTLQFPVDVDLHDGAGGVQRTTWDGKGPFTVLEYSGPSPLIGAVVDPEGKIPLDQNLLNNSFFVQQRAPSRTLEQATYLSQLLLHLAGP